MQYRSQGIKRRHSHLNCTQKLDKNSTQKLFKQPKGLAVCELQAAGPLVLRVGGADKNLDSQRALERSPFVYSYEKKSIALKVFHQTNSVSETIRILGYPTRRQLYSWIDDENLPSKERKPLPRIANSPDHPRNPPLDVKLDAIKRCFELCIIELVFDAEGHGVDFVFRYCNDEMSVVEGVPVSEMLNRSFYEVFENGDKKWLVTYADVALNGNKHILQDYSPEIDKTLTIYCFQPASGYCACVLIPS